MLSKDQIKIINNDYVLLPENDNDSLVAAIQNQPVSVAIDGEAPQLYTQGVFDSVECTTQVNHAVLAVGYGEENGQKYYQVKNSWGDDFGLKGYIKFLRKDGYNTGTCGIATYCVYPTVWNY